jgi:hypothetical protein
MMTSPFIFLLGYFLHNSERIPVQMFTVMMTSPFILLFGYFLQNFQLIPVPMFNDDISVYSSSSVISFIIPPVQLFNDDVSVYPQLFPSKLPADSYSNV